jgi:hypothetical protein
MWRACETERERKRKKKREREREELIRVVANYYICETTSEINEFVEIV